MRKVLPNQIYSLDSLDYYRGIYFLYDGDELVYVGQAENVLVRLSAHRKETSKEFDSFSWISMPNGNLNQTKAEYISQYRPRLNKNLPANTRYRQGKAVLKAYYQRYGRHTSESELNHPSVVKFRLSDNEYAKTYYDLESLFAHLDSQDQEVVS